MSKTNLTPEEVFPQSSPKHLLEIISSRERYFKLMNEYTRNQENFSIHRIRILGTTSEEINPVNNIIVAYKDGGLEYLTGFTEDSFQCSLWIPEPNIILTYHHKPQSKRLQGFIETSYQKNKAF